MDHRSDSERINEKIWDTLDKVRRACRFSVEDMEEYLELPNGKYERFLFKKKALTTRELLKLSERLEISIDRIFEGNIDYFALAARESGHDLLVQNWSSC